MIVLLVPGVPGTPDAVLLPWIRARIQEGMPYSAAAVTAREEGYRVGTPRFRVLWREAGGTALRHNGQRLTAPQVRLIRAAQGILPAEVLAAQYGVSRSTIWAAWSGRHYRWVL